MFNFIHKKILAISIILILPFPYHGHHNQVPSVNIRVIESIKDRAAAHWDSFLRRLLKSKEIALGFWNLDAEGRKLTFRVRRVVFKKKLIRYAANSRLFYSLSVQLFEPIDQMNTCCIDRKCATVPWWQWLRSVNATWCNMKIRWFGKVTSQRRSVVNLPLLKHEAPSE